LLSQEVSTRVEAQAILYCFQFVSNRVLEAQQENIEELIGLKEEK